MSKRRQEATSTPTARAAVEEVLRMLLVEPLPTPGDDYPFLLEELVRAGRLPATVWWTREFIRLGLPLTPEMRKVAVDALDDHGRWQQKQKGKRGAPIRNADRDSAIVFAIVQAEIAGLRPTRNEEPRGDRESGCRESGCDVVSEILSALGIELGYKGVVKVWEKYRRGLLAGEAIASGTRKP